MDTSVPVMLSNYTCVTSGCPEITEKRIADTLRPPLVPRTRALARPKGAASKAKAASNRKEASEANGEAIGIRTEPVRMPLLYWTPFLSRRQLFRVQTRTSWLMNLPVATCPYQAGRLSRRLLLCPPILLAPAGSHPRKLCPLQRCYLRGLFHKRFSRKRPPRIFLVSVLLVRLVNATRSLMNAT